MRMMTNAQQGTAKAIRWQVDAQRRHSSAEGERGDLARYTLGVLYSLALDLSIELGKRDASLDIEEFRRACGFGFGVSVWYGERAA